MNVIPDNTLIDYVLDLLDESERKAIEAKMSKSTDLFARVARLRDTLLVTPALACSTVEPSAGLLERLIKSTNPASPFEGFIDRLSVFLDLPEQQTRDLLVDIAFAETEWEAIGIPGILGKQFKGGPRHSDAECSLLVMQPGAVIPNHGHHGDEWGFVLQGEATEDNGRVIHAGEMVYQSENTRHSITNTGDSSVVFALVHRGIRFN